MCNNTHSVRLVDGANTSAVDGRVEICDEGVWKRVCDRGWNQNKQNGQVVCRELGYNATQGKQERSQ